MLTTANNNVLSAGGTSITNLVDSEGKQVIYHAHTADNYPRPSDGRGVGGEGWSPPPEDRWQLLSVHLRNVADLAKEFATVVARKNDLSLAVLLSDL